MSRIQELLAKQRGQQNVTVEKSVLQPKSEETTKPVETPQSSSTGKIDEKRQSLFAKLGKKPAGNPTGTAPVVEQGTIKVIANGHDVTDKMPLTVKELTKQRAEENDPKLQPLENGENKSDLVQGVSEIKPTGSSVNTGPVEEIATPEIMPAGLSMLAQMKWKKEHVHKTIPSGEVPSVGKEDTSNQKLSSEIEKQTPLQSDGNIASPSQQADAQKTNDGTANIEELKRNLAYLANNIENKEIVGQVVRTIASQLKNSPELCPGMTNADVNLVVRGARMAYQVAAMRKQEKADIKKFKSKDTEALDAFFKDAGINFNM